MLKNNHKNIVFGFLGVQKDAAFSVARWERWRPTIGLVMQPDFIVDKLELLVDLRREQKLAEWIKADIAQVSPQTEVILHDMYLPNPWDFENVYAKLHDFCENYDFMPEKNNYFAHITTGTHVAQICWFLLTESHDFRGKLIQTSPNNFINHNLNNNNKIIGEINIVDLDLAKYDQISKRFELQKKTHYGLLKQGIETKNKNYNNLIINIEKVALRSRAPMLLTGETGVGKTHLARKIYELKKQKTGILGQFIEINCATLRGDMAMSMLFGHNKGAFTGALQARAGLLKAADQGVLFLDEIGELGLDEQAMLLRALEEKRFLPMGSDREISSDFQLLAGTNRDLYQDIIDKKFRADLYARLNLWTFNLPNLRERPEDIAPNIQYELQKFAQEYGQKIVFTNDAYVKYCEYACSEAAQWAGNFRDLHASITRLATFAEGGKIELDQVIQEINYLTNNHQIIQEKTSKNPENIVKILEKLQNKIDFFDYQQLEFVLNICAKHTNMAEASRELFNVSRLQKTTQNDSDRLRKYLAKYELTWADLV